ncbi:MAG: hypothetical protein FWE59_06645 [Oscillospiraceae bacterium]|nr:hypothetical protein [Oscillospiraceae bacterium]
MAWTVTNGTDYLAYLDYLDAPKKRRRGLPRRCFSESGAPTQLCRNLYKRDQQ